jgi:lipopolysaccharide export system protein LptA
MRMTLSRPRVTIERLRTLVLIGGALLVAAIVAFLAAGQWTRRFLTKDLPHRLGIDIEQSADGVNYTQTRKGKTIFKIHAARALKMKGDGKTELQDVHIDLYGEDGNRTDTISGAEFEYDPNGGLATAAGAVEITLMRPGVKPAIAQLKPGASKANSGSEPMVPKGRGTSAATDSKGAGTAGGAGNAITDNEIHVKTSGLTFNQKTGIATTAEQVDFVLRQGRGSSIGAVYDSTGGELVLDHAVVLHAERGVSGDGTAASNRGPVTIHASHAEFEREEMACRLTQARADYSGGSAQATDALVHFREDGSVIRLDGSGGVDLRTDTGSHVTAPVGSLDFDESNHPHLGVLRGGAHIETTRASRQVQGSAPTARLTFDSKGELSLAHLEQGVAFTSEQQGTTAKGMAVQLHRTWQSQSADVVFAPAGPLAQSEAAPVLGRVQPSSHVEARTIRGFGGVVVNSESTSGGVRAPSRFAADSMVAELAAGGALSSLFGTGHASLDERTAAGVHQASSADQLEVRFAPASAGARSAPAAATKAKDSEAAQIASVVEIGHVVLVQDPSPARPGQAGDAGDAEVAKSGIRATANRADYDGQSQLLHLTGTPRVVDGPLDMTANRIDFARVSGDAFAHGDVRASWVGGAGSGTSLLAGTGSGQNANGPVHAIAAEAELHQATQEVIFHRGCGSRSTRFPRR